jgi:acyl-CoA synthetase (AMP-forming)/AMP-acid ligase II
MTYIDVLHIYGVSRAGYVPQLFSLRLPSSEVILELLHIANAKALIYDSLFQSILGDSPVPILLAVNSDTVKVESGIERLPDLHRVDNGDDIAFIFHTSGSTSGRPKLVPCSYRWLDAAIHKAGQVSSPKCTSRRDVAVWMGSMAHIAQTTSEHITLQAQILLILTRNFSAIRHPSARVLHDPTHRSRILVCGAGRYGSPMRP